MKKAEDKSLSSRELNNTVGGIGPSANQTRCPNCKNYYSTKKVEITVEEGCHTKSLGYKCPGCGYEWK